MKHVIITTFSVGIMAYILGPTLWPLDNHYENMVSAQYSLLQFLSFLEALLFGLGISFLLYSYPILKKLPFKSTQRRATTYISIAWLLLSWWPHDHLHLVAGSNLQFQLYVEYFFHIPTIFASFGLAITTIELISHFVTKEQTS